MSTTTYNAKHMIATNGGDFDARTDAIINRHQAEIDAWLADEDNAFEFNYNEREQDDMIAAYSAEYFCENQSAGDIEQSARTMGVVDAHDIQIDGMAPTVAHSQFNVNALCYAPLDVRDLRDTAPALANMETRDATLAANKAHRAEQLQRHMAKPAKGYAAQVAEGKAKAKRLANTRTGDAASREERALKRLNKTRRKCGLEPLTEMPAK